MEPGVQGFYRPRKRKAHLTGLGKNSPDQRRRGGEMDGKKGTKKFWGPDEISV
jgi:hypothetical protein